MALTKIKQWMIESILGTQVTYTSGIGLASSTLSAALEEMYILATYRRRQCAVLSPVNSTTGMPNWLPSTDADLTLASQNISASAPLVVVVANGDTTRRGKTTSNLTWTGLTAASTNYLYVDVSAAGALTTGFTTLAPVYQAGGTYSTTNGQFTFNWGEMVGKVGNGSTAAQTYRVFVGEAVTDGTGVTSTVCYANNGEYISAQTAVPALGTVTTFSHNIGAVHVNMELHLVNLTTQFNYAVGDRIIIPVTGQTTTDVYQLPSIYGSGRNAVKHIMGASQRFILPNATTGAYALGDVTAGNWEMQMFAKRAW